ncbi:MAG TPA: 3-isopropylmalate dehydratase small subunit [Nitrososphaera sp.]|nr:3-isopropylmalate dehydratase small subunit [Nitrososphaera sp.]
MTAEDKAMNNTTTSSSQPQSPPSSSASPLMPSPPKSTNSPFATEAVLEGKAWVFGDDINTDIIMPFRFKSRTNDPNEMAKYAMYGIDPDFHKKIDKGDILVAGRNFGGGSSREQAPLALQYAGISAIVAESFARIFYRNAFSIGLPALETPGIKDHVVQGDRLIINLGEFTVTNTRTGHIFQAKAVPDFMRKMLLDGGLIEYFKKNQKFPWS